MLGRTENRSWLALAEPLAIASPGRPSLRVALGLVVMLGASAVGCGDSTPDGGGSSAGGRGGETSSSDGGGGETSSSGGGGGGAPPPPAQTIIRGELACLGGTRTIVCEGDEAHGRVSETYAELDCSTVDGRISAIFSHVTTGDAADLEEGFARIFGACAGGNGVDHYIGIPDDPAGTIEFTSYEPDDHMSGTWRTTDGAFQGTFYVYD